MQTDPAKSRYHPYPLGTLQQPAPTPPLVATHWPQYTPHGQMMPHRHQQFVSPYSLAQNQGPTQAPPFALMPQCSHMIYGRSLDFSLSGAANSHESNMTSLRTLDQYIESDIFKKNFRPLFNYLHNDFVVLTTNLPSEADENFFAHVRLLMNLFTKITTFVKQNSDSQARVGSKKPDNDPIILKINRYIKSFAKNAFARIELSENSVRELDCQKGIFNHDKCLKFLCKIEKVHKILKQKSIAFKSSHLMRIIGNYDNIDSTLDFIDENFATFAVLNQKLYNSYNLSQLLGKSNGEPQTLVEKFNFLTSRIEVVKGLVSARNDKEHDFPLKFINKCPLNLSDTIDLAHQIKESFIEVEKELIPSKKRVRESDPRGWIIGWEILSQFDYSPTLHPREAFSLIMKHRQKIAECTTFSGGLDFRLNSREIAKILLQPPSQCEKILEFFSDITKRDADQFTRSQLKSSDIKRFLGEFLEIVADEPERKLERFLKIIRSIDFNTNSNTRIIWACIPKIMNSDLTIEQIDTNVTREFYQSEISSRVQSIIAEPPIQQQSDLMEDGLIIVMPPEGERKPTRSEKRGIGNSASIAKSIWESEDSPAVGDGGGLATEVTTEPSTSPYHPSKRRPPNTFMSYS